jgi:hypothetical protein
MRRDPPGSRRDRSAMQRDPSGMQRDHRRPSGTQSIEYKTYRSLKEQLLR